jgi:hypothetical protein
MRERCLGNLAEKGIQNPIPYSTDVLQDANEVQSDELGG